MTDQTQMDIAYSNLAAHCMTVFSDKKLNL